MAARKLRILCLHGYQQNATQFHAKTGSLRGMFKKKAEFVYIDAPYEVTWDPGHPARPTKTADESKDGSGAAAGDEATDEAKHAQQPGYSWYKWDPTVSPLVYSGVPEALDLIASVAEKQGPFDGLVGFSQGAAMAALVAAHTVHPDASERRAFPFKFCVLYSGFRVRDERYHSLLCPESPLRFPVLSVSGETDGIITPEQSSFLNTCFVDSTLLTHPGGHYVPGKRAFCRQVKEFMLAHNTPLPGAADETSGAGGEGPAADAAGATTTTERPVPTAPSMTAAMAATPCVRAAPLIVEDETRPA